MIPPKGDKSFVIDRILFRFVRRFDNDSPERGRELKKILRDLQLLGIDLIMIPPKGDENLISSQTSLTVTDLIMIPPKGDENFV